MSSKNRVRRLPPVCAVVAVLRVLTGRLRVETRYVGSIFVMEDGQRFRVFRHLSLSENEEREQSAPAPAVLVVRSEGDLHFVCDGDVGGTESHAELHMHGVHFQKKGESLLIWMDMLENGEVAFQTTYELVRAD